MDRWLGKVAVVTGASVGIGAAVATELVKHGMKVVGLARRVDKLQELASQLGKGKFYPIQCDLKKEEDILKAFQWAEKELGGVDVLVNNAGVVVPGPIIDGSTEDFRHVMDINVIAMAICTREAVRSMKKRDVAGHVFNINSMAGHYAEALKIPFGLYPASKYAVTAMTLGIRHELTSAKMDVKITSISPGAVATEMTMPFAKYKIPMLNGKDVADAVIYALGAAPGAEIYDILIAPHDKDQSEAQKKFWEGRN